MLRVVLHRDVKVVRQQLLQISRVPFENPVWHVGDRQNTRTLDRLKLGQQLIFDLLVGMKDESRQMFADRLEENLAKGPKHRDKAAAP